MLIILASQEAEAGDLRYEASLSKLVRLWSQREKLSISVRGLA